MSAILTIPIIEAILWQPGGSPLSEIDPRVLDDDLLYRAIGCKIRDIRLARSPKLTQGRLAELLSLERTSVTNIEKGVQRPPISFLYRLALALEIPLTELLPLPIEVSVRRLSGGATGELDVPPKTARLISRLSVPTSKATRIRR